GFDADDTIRQTTHGDLRAYCISCGKEFRCYVRADVSDSSRILILWFSDESTFSDVTIFDVDAIRSGARNKNIFEHFVVALGLDWSASRSCANLADERGTLFQVLVVLQGQLFVASLSCGDGVSVFEVFEGIEALDVKRFGADACDLLVDVTIEARD